MDWLNLFDHHALLPRHEYRKNRQEQYATDRPLEVQLLLLVTILEVEEPMEEHHEYAHHVAAQEQVERNHPTR
jgi:hypothetical protein